MRACNCSHYQSHARSRLSLAVDHPEATSPKDNGRLVPILLYNNLENTFESEQRHDLRPVGGKPISVAPSDHRAR
jgi:hypothetical protein